MTTYERKTPPALLLIPCFVALLFSSFTCRAYAADKPRTNILFIYTDDQSHRTVSCYPEAHDWVRTPNINALAKRGMRFTHAYIGTWCMPSRATLLTGHHQFAVESMRMEGPYPGGTYDPKQCPFWPSEFRRNGYTTGQIGKWHTGTDTGFGRDWDYQAVWNRPKYTKNAGKYYDDQLISFNGEEARPVKGYSTDNYTDWAVDFIRGQHRDPTKPWYLWLCYGAVHGPSIPAPRHRDAYPDARVPTPVDIYPPRPGKPAHLQKLETWIPNAQGEPVLKTGKEPIGNRKTLTEQVRQYQQCVLAIDEGVGRLVKALNETGQTERTLIVFTSDQGFAWGQHGFRAQLAPYDDNLRAPLIASLPGAVPQNSVCKVPVGGADLVPTFFHFAGIEHPWTMHGRDLSPLLHNPNATLPRPLLLTSTGASFGSDTKRIPAEFETTLQNVPWWVFLRDQRYKYIRTLVANEVEELYDLETDPQELTNLALDAAQASRLTSMREQAVAELRRAGAAMADHLPPVKTAGR